MEKFKILEDSERVVTLQDGTEVKLYSIEALIDIPSKGVSAGDLGGWLEDESCLSQEGESWVTPSAHVLKGARVSGNAWVRGTSILAKNSRVLDDTVILNSLISDSFISGKVVIEKSTIISCTFYDNVEIQDSEIRKTTAWDFVAKESKLLSTTSSIFIAPTQNGHPSRMEASTVYYTSKRKLKITENWNIIRTKIRSLKTLSLSSPLTIVDVESIGSAFIYSMKNKKAVHTNELNGADGKLVLLNQTKIYLQDSRICRYGILQGAIHLEDSEILGCGDIKNEKIGGLYLQSVLMDDMSSIQKNTERIYELKNVELRSEDQLIC